MTQTNSPISDFQRGMPAVMALSPATVTDTDGGERG
jgi:hypothetical protein